MICRDHLLLAGRWPQTFKKARKPPSNWVGQMKKKKESGQDLCHKEGAVKEEMFLNPVKSPHWRRDQPGQSQISFRGEWPAQTVPPPCAPQPQMLILQCGQRPGAEARASEVRPRERTGVGCTEIAWRGWRVATEGVLRRSLGLPQR